MPGWLFAIAAGLIAIFGISKFRPNRRRRATEKKGVAVNRLSIAIVLLSLLIGGFSDKLR